LKKKAESKKEECSWKCPPSFCGAGSHGAGTIYAFGLFGAAYYYITTAPDFWGAVIGVVKAIFWPAFLVYGALVFMGTPVA
jgi:hypothetical protein